VICPRNGPYVQADDPSEVTIIGSKSAASAGVPLFAFQQCPCSCRFSGIRTVALNSSLRPILEAAAFQLPCKQRWVWQKCCLCCFGLLLLLAVQNQDLGSASCSQMWTAYCSVRGGGKGSSANPGLTAHVDKGESAKRQSRARKFGFDSWKSGLERESDQARVVQMLQRGGGRTLALSPDQLASHFSAPERRDSHILRSPGEAGRGRVSEPCYFQLKLLSSPRPNLHRQGCSTVPTLCRARSRSVVVGSNRQKGSLR
jgi:hypothetical protein